MWVHGCGYMDGARLPCLSVTWVHRCPWVIGVLGYNRWVQITPSRRFSSTLMYHVSVLSGCIDVLHIDGPRLHTQSTLLLLPSGHLSAPPFSCPPRRSGKGGNFQNMPKSGGCNWAEKHQKLNIQITIRDPPHH